MQQRIASIWAEVLEIDSVASQDNFFDLGGYSLLAVRVLERMAEECGVQLELEDLVFQTLRQIAAKCAK